MKIEAQHVQPGDHVERASVCSVLAVVRESRDQHAVGCELVDVEVAWVPPLKAQPLWRYWYSPTETVHVKGMTNAGLH